MKKILTGLQPTGEITLGNYIGAIKQMAKLQEEYDSYIFVADENNGIVSSAELEGTFSDWPEQIAIFKNCVLHEN